MQIRARDDRTRDVRGSTSQQRTSVAGYAKREIFTFKQNRERAPAEKEKKRGKVRKLISRRSLSLPNFRSEIAIPDSCFHLVSPETKANLRFIWTRYGLYVCIVAPLYIC